MPGPGRGSGWVGEQGKRGGDRARLPGVIGILLHNRGGKFVWSAALAEAAASITIYMMKVHGKLQYNPIWWQMAQDLQE